MIAYKLQKYQGSFINKDEIKKTFDKKFAEGRKWDMPEMELFLSHVLDAFQSQK